MSVALAHPTTLNDLGRELLQYRRLLPALASYTVSQRWSQAIHDHPDERDGILYRPRHDPARLAPAIFDRITDRVTTETLGTWVDQKAVLADVLDTYGVALVS